ncbi:MAG: hypothetical protein MZU97_07620 [Bacillus subtilis]|nr:hypothetical protein [Bacillus subtilis]
MLDHNNDDRAISHGKKAEHYIQMINSSIQFLIGGQILDDYAAIMPEDLIDGEEGLILAIDGSNKVFPKQKVNHIIMMVSKLNRRNGLALLVTRCADL